MALTPEEVVNKRFQPTKFREGYDQDEVDDFLDEVVNELRRLNAENDELRQKLAACERRVGELTRAGARVETAPEPQRREAPEPAPSPPVPVPAPVATPAAREPEPAVSAPVAASSGPEAAAGMLALAQKLHDDHVKAGEEQRDKLIAEAKEHATRLVREAEEKQRQTLGALEQERSVLERKIDQLRAFEREYRSRLKSYLESQLRELENSGTVVPSGHGAQQPQPGGGFGFAGGTISG